MVANTDPRNFTITIDILDSDRNVLTAGIDIANVVESISLSRTEFNATTPNGYHPCTGTFTLKAFNNVDFTTSTDPRSTTGTPIGVQLYTYGNRVNLAIEDTTGTLRQLCPLFLTETPDPANLGDNPLVLTIGDESKLIDYDDTPEGDLSEVLRGTERTASAIANSILAVNGLPVSADGVSAYPVAVELQKNDTRSWDGFIGNLMANRGHYFWIDGTGATRFTPIDFEQDTPLLTLTIGGDNGDEIDSTNGWRRVKNAAAPPEKLTCYATGSTPVEIENPRDIDVTIPGDGFTAETTTGSESWTFGISPTYVLDTTTRRAEKLILPEVRTLSSGFVTGLTPNTSTTLRDSSSIKRTVEYSNFYGHKLRETVVERIARAEAGGNAYDPIFGDITSDAFNLLTITTTITCEYNRITGYMERRVTSKTTPWCLVEWTGDRPANYENNRFLVREVFRNTETWEKAQGSVFGAGADDLPQRWRYKSTVLQPRGVVENPYFGINADVLGEDHTQSFDKTGSGREFEPPRPEYQQDRYNLNRKQFQGSANFTPAAGAAYKNKLDTISLRGSDITSNSHCAFLAQVLGLFRYGRAQGYQFVGAIPDWLFTGYRPGARIDVTVDGQVLACLLDGWTMTIDQTSAVWGASLVFVGVVGVTPDVVTPPVSVVIAPENYPAIFAQVPSIQLDASIVKVYAAITANIPAIVLDAVVTDAAAAGGTAWLDVDNNADWLAINTNADWIGIGDAAAPQWAGMTQEQWTGIDTNEEWTGVT